MKPINKIPRLIRIATAVIVAGGLAVMVLSAQDDLDTVRQAAEQGDADRTVQSRDHVRQGEGVPKDDAEAVKWFRLAAEQGYADAQFNLGGMYANGEGVPKDDAEALRWYRLAAEQGQAAAQFNLGAAYTNGQGVLKDDAEAVKWFRLAAEQGSPQRSSISGSCTTKARVSSRTMPKPCAGIGWPPSRVCRAQFNLGIMYANGEGVLKDDAEAVKWYRLAAEQGHANAQYNLGVMYDNGIGVLKDDAEAVKWYRLAAEQGYANAQHNLGAMYADGRGVPQGRCRSREMVPAGRRARVRQGAGRPRGHVRQRAGASSRIPCSRTCGPTSQAPTGTKRPGNNETTSKTT